MVVVNTVASQEGGPHIGHSGLGSGPSGFAYFPRAFLGSQALEHSGSGIQNRKHPASSVDS